MLRSGIDLIVLIDLAVPLYCSGIRLELFFLTISLSQITLDLDLEDHMRARVTLFYYDIPNSDVVASAEIASSALTATSADLETSADLGTSTAAVEELPLSLQDKYSIPHQLALQVELQTLEIGRGILLYWYIRYRY